MFELGTTDHWWKIAKRYPQLSNHEQTLKPLGYAHMINLIETFRPKRILEVGHGAGSFLFEILKDDIEVWGLDDTIEDNAVSVDSLKSTRNKHPHVKFVTGLLGNNSNDLPDNYFDLVCSVSVLEHIPVEQLNSVFADTFRILKPGGIVSHSYDISYRRNTKSVFDAYEKCGFEWLKSKERMTVFWEEWLCDFDKEQVEDIIERLMTENPIFVAEKFMWQIERNRRPSPINFVTVLSAARKPLEANIGKQKSTCIEALPLNFSIKNFDEFTYSKKTHIDEFKREGIDLEISGSPVNIDYCDLKTYQEMLILSLIKNNLKEGSRILEIGNNYPSLLNKLKSKYECTEFHTPNADMKYFPDSLKEGIKFRQGELLTGQNDLENEHYDLVFCVSNLGISTTKQSEFGEIANEIRRALKKGGFSILCFPAIWREPSVSLPEMSEYLINNKQCINETVSGLTITLDDELFYISEKYYREKWEPHTGRSYKKFGKPFSYNLLLIKE